MSRYAVLACAAAMAAAIPALALAETWPAKPVHFVVPAPPGSSLDVVARTLGEQLSQRWKQPVIVDNKAGAGGMLGMDAAAKAPADGYTLAVGFNGPIAFGPYLYKKMPYDPGKDLLPVVLATSQPNVLAVNAGNPAKTLPELVAWAKQQGQQLSYGSVGNGSSSHLTMELFKSIAGFDAVHVPYSGSPPAATALAANETQLLFAVEPALKSLVQAGRIRLVAATSLQRSETLKDLPTFAEAGFPGFEAMAWNGFFTRAGTPPEVVSRINADVNATLALPAVRELLLRQGLVPGGGSPAEFKALVAEEGKRWGAIIEKVGIKLD